MREHDGVEIEDVEISLQDEVLDYIQHNSLKKKDFAANVGVSPSDFSNWLYGNRTFSPTVTERIRSIVIYK